MARFDDLPRDVSLTTIYGHAGKIFEEQVRRDPQTDYTQEMAFNTAIWYIAQEAQLRGFIALRGQSVQQIGSGIAIYATRYLRSRAEVYARHSELPDRGGIDLHVAGNEPVPPPSHPVDQTDGLNMEKKEVEENVSTLRIRIIEEPLTIQNLTTTFSALTELSTKCWLIATGRFADLSEYTQTHHLRLSEEAQFVVTRVTYNSPFDMSVNFPNLDPKNLTAALKEGIDTVLQTKERLKQAELDTQAKTEQLKQVERKSFQEYSAKKQELEIAAQKATDEHQIAQLEQEKQKFELEKQRLLLQMEQEKQKLELEKQQLDLQRQRLEIENMRMNYAIEAANKIISLLSPTIDQATREMMIPTLLPNLLQFQSVKGLELALLAPQKP